MKDMKKEKSAHMTTLTSPHDLLAAVPFLIGYHPKNSIVLIAITEGSLGMAMRIDYPEEVDLDQIDTLANHLLQQKAEAALVVAYVPDTIFETEYLLHPIREAIAMRQIDLRECLVVRGDRWKSSICADEGCCPPEGNPLPALIDSRIAAEQVALGRPLPFESMDSLRNSLATVENAEITEQIQNINEIDYEGGQVLELQREGALALNEFADEFERVGIVKSSALITLVLVRLKDLQVRDYALGITTGENISTVWSMWRWLLTIAPQGYVAPVATIFAAICYEEGDGLLAQKALDRAFEDDTKYPLAKLLRRCFSAGWPPQTFVSMRAELHPKICASLFGE